MKSQKEIDSPLTKQEHGQILNAEQWFRKEYPEMIPVKIVVGPNRYKTEQTIVSDTKVLTFDKLNTLVHSLRKLLVVLCNSLESADHLAHICEELLTEYELMPSNLHENYLQGFE